MTRLIRNTLGVVLCLFFVLPQLEAQQIKYAEYFFDNDPGRGNATSVSITQANTIDANFSISTAGLSSGIHFLYFRFKDTDAKWSLSDFRLLYITTNTSNSNITAAEYFFDNDPGKGNGTSVSLTSGATIDINKSIATSGITAGIHFLFFRVKNADGLWSLAESKLLYITENSTTSSITAAEYFFDNDPGKGNGTSVSLTSGATIDINKSIATSGISAGIHFLYFRVRNADGLWSLAESKLLYITENSTMSNITAAEYYFDTDPGFGSATAFSVTAGDTVNINSAISIASLSSGLHYLYARVKNANGKWSLSEERLLYKSPDINNGQITAAEYFYDTDPGFGNATSISVAAGDTINLTAILSTTGLSPGIHHFYVRVKNGNGRWSLNSHRLIYVKAGNLSIPRITEAEYFFDSDPGQGNATAFSVTAGNTIDVTAAIASSSLSIGSHRFYVRAKDSLGRWSLNDQRLVYVSPALANQKISAIEYSVDTIMPFGQGNIVNFSPTDSLDYTFTFTHGLIDTFYHALYTRVRTVGGQWSLVDSIMFRMENCIIPTAQFNINDLCFGDSIILYNNSLDTDTSTVYAWDIGNDGFVESTDSTSYTAKFTQTGTYKISLKVTNYVCIDTMIQTMHVYPRPDTTLSIFGSTAFCPGSFAVLSANTGVGYQYQWLKNGGLIANATSNFYQAQDSGIYAAALTNIYNCKDTTSTIALSVYNLPSASITNSGANAFCQGDSVLLTANQMGGLTYQWYKNGDTIAGETASSLWVTQAGDYKVKITNINGCSDISAPVNIAVNPVPQATIAAGGATTFCQGDNVVLYGSNGIGYSYQWFKDGSPVSGATSSFYQASQAGDYRVLVSNAYQCSDTSSATTVTVNPSPVSVINITGQSTVCQGDTVKLSGPPTAGLTYQWKSYGTNLAGAVDSVYYALQTGNYSLITTNSFNCSTESAQQLATVNPVPGASVLPLSSTSFCGGDSVILQANAGSGLSYQWFKNNTITTGDTLSNFVADSSGSYSVKVSNTYNCSSVSSPVNVTVYPIPTSDFSIPATVCSSDTATISYTGSASAGAFYNWNFGGGIVLSGTGQGPYQVQWSTAGVKNISLMVNENSCSSLLTGDSTEIMTVVSTITAPLTSVCQGDSVLLTANSGQSLSYQWMMGGVPLTGDTLSSLNVMNTGLYKVNVTDNQTGCSQLSQPVTVTINTTDFSMAFSANTTTFTQPPFAVAFTNQTPNLNNYNFQWELGDGNTSTFFNPMHTYQYNGSYSVSLFAENASTGCRDTLVKTNYISCAGGVPNPCNIIAAITPAGPVTICGGDSVMLTASAGTGYNYQWVYNNMIIPNADSIIFWAKQAGNYRVVVSDSVCSQTSPAFVLNHYPSIHPVIQSLGQLQPCTFDSMQLSLYVNYNSYNWSTGDTTSTIWIDQTGYYQVAVTDNYGCNLTSQPFVVSNSFLNPPEICIVGVDTANHNRLVWERQANNLIDSFYIYREGFMAGQYDKIGAIPFTQTSMFVDTNSNPAVKAYRYRIAAVDTCGGVTLLSQYHKTIHLTINAGLNGSWNLIWDGYQGFPFSTYRIYRGVSINNMSLLTQLPSSATSYTDLNPPSGMVYYQIEIIKATGCYPDTVMNKANTNYNISRSNTANNGNITPVYLSAAFSANVLMGQWPIQVKFTDASTGSPGNWLWDFGDGNTSIEQNPMHTYNNTGLYTVRLKVCNGTICDTVIKTDYINVLPNGMVEIGVELAARLFPNPNDGNFTLEIADKASRELRLHIYNALGSEVYTESFKTNGGITKTLRLNHLAQGVYYVHLNTKDKIVYRTKVVIQR